MLAFALRSSSRRVAARGRVWTAVAVGALALALVQPSAAHAASPTLRVNDLTVTERNASGLVANVAVVLSRAMPRRVTVQYTTVNGTAKAPGDYAARSGTAVFPAGVKKAVVPVAIKGDLLDENDEKFRVRISNPTRAVIADAVGVIQIVDNDPLPQLSAGNAKAVEPNSGATQQMSFPVTLSAPSGRRVSVSYVVTAGTATAGTDFSVPVASGVMKFPAGVVTRHVAMTVLGDNLDEANETVNLVLVNPTNATLATSAATATIVDNDGPALFVGSTSKNEGWTPNNIYNFNVSLSAPSPQEVRVNWATANGTAVAPSDYSANSGTLVFAPGQTVKTASVAVQGDIATEGHETFRVNLSAPVNATIGGGQGTATIVNDDCSSFDEGSSAAFNLGSLSGDTGSGVRSRTDNICVNDADWHKISLTEDDSSLFSSRDLTARISLNVWNSPAQTSGDLDMCVYRANLSLVGCGSNGGVTDEQLLVKKADNVFSWDSTTVYVKVFGFQNNKMNNYTLSINGNVSTGIAPNL
ncbi:MAG: hypothetical protein GEU74_06145 [Nitriliruptorales bacterium]|nr:hypothetical protein [Nitriliruptorales bacterium]